MSAKILVLGLLITLAVALTLLLFYLAKRGRSMRRFADRQQFYHDLYRFTVSIVTGFALYLVGQDPALFQILPLPDFLLIFAVTALPTLLLCLLSGRWYLGYIGVLLVQGFSLNHVSTYQPDALHDGVLFLLAQHALLDLAGLGLYGLLVRLTSKTRAEEREHRLQQRFLSKQKAGHANPPILM